MENINKEYYETDSIYIANTLSFLGFRYYKFKNFKNEEVYSFINTKNLQLAVNKIFQSQNDFRKILNV